VVGAPSASWNAPSRGVSRGYSDCSIERHVPEEQTEDRSALPHVVENKGYTVLGTHGREVLSVVDLTSATTPDLMAWLERQFGKEITTRIWKTVGRSVHAWIGVRGRAWRRLSRATREPTDPGRVRAARRV
jgi:hypothetical protein